MNEDKITERFLRETSAHKLSVIRDSGINRHIRLKRPGTNNQYFDLITWPGHLCICGDMGTWVFSRLPDMFEFFRRAPRDAEPMPINTGYWAEKLEAHDARGRHTNSGAMEFSKSKFRDIIVEGYIQHVRENMRGMPAERKELRAELEDEVLNYVHDGELPAMQAAAGFRMHGLSFEDIWECEVREYTFHFVWCCCAIVWGIQQYDEWKDRPWWCRLYDGAASVVSRIRLPKLISRTAERAKA